MQTNARRYALTLLVVALLGVAACGGSEDAKPTATATPEPTPPALNDLVAQYQSSIVDIATTGPDGSGGGTGIVWETPNQVLTNAHVVLGAATIKVNDPVTKGKQYPAVVVALSPLR